MNFISINSMRYIICKNFKGRNTGFFFSYLISSLSARFIVAQHCVFSFNSKITYLSWHLLHLTYRMLEGVRCPSASPSNWRAETPLMLHQWQSSFLKLAKAGYVHSNLDNFFSYVVKPEIPSVVLANSWISLLWLLLQIL